MPIENIRTAVDHAINDKPAEMKDALYDAINDKIFAAIEQRKIAVAANMLNVHQEVDSETE